MRLITVLAPFLTLAMVTGQRDSTDVQLTTAEPCGGDYQGTDGTIVSPNFPNDYPVEADCQWTVTSLDNTAIMVNFEIFKTASESDYLEIRDGNNSDDPLIVKLYGHVTNIDEIISTGNSLFFFFQSRGSSVEKGFKLNWTTGLAYCYYCDNYPGTTIYDPACGEDAYHGKTTDDPYTVTCYTNVHYDGSHRVERGYTYNIEEDGVCYDSGFSLTCYCARKNNCNNNLCQNCTTTMPPPTTTITSTLPAATTNTQPAITTTEPPITSTQPSASTPPPTTSNQPPTPVGTLECYSCIDCNIITEDTNIEASEEFLSCFVAIEHIDNGHLVIRGGSHDYNNDGICHEVHEAILCYCTSNRCNSQ